MLFRPVSPASRAKGQMLKFLCDLKGRQMQTGTHPTLPTAGSFFFLTVSAIVGVATALINSFILVLQELNVPGKNTFFDKLTGK